MTPIVTCKGLSHSYEDIHALGSIDLSVNEGELFGFIGPDGAGKTTLFRIIASLTEHFKGDVKVLGYDPAKEYKEIRKRIGYMPGRFSLYHDLTVEENLKFYAAVFGNDVDSNYHLISDIFDQLAPFKKRRAGKLSGGMKQKLALSCALIHQPELLILDEPTTGVDSVSRIEFWDVLSRLKESGMTILVSTPYMDEARRCDKIALMQKGEILMTDSPLGISESFLGDLMEIRHQDRFRILDLLRLEHGESSAYLFGQTIHLVTNNHSVDDIEVLLTKNGIDDAVVQPLNPSIEDCFIQLMGGKDD
ncbi:MAG: ABC transporter ATP-binding protein [Bacteroidales bacterium]|nr:ABC transporter ATP-binding protein [Bacteroidales bacterium]